MQVVSVTASTWQGLGVLATFVGTVLTIVVSWIKERNASARRIQILDEAKRYVEFWKAYTDITSGTFEDRDLAALSRATARNLKMIEEYIEYEVTQPIRKAVTDAPVWWVRREVFKERAKAAARTWGVVTPIVFFLLLALEKTDALSYLPYLLEFWQAPSAVLEVSSDRPGARVSVDGNVIGLTNLAIRVKPGIHDIVAERDGKTVRERVVVDNNRYVKINVSNVSLP